MVNRRRISLQVSAISPSGAGRVECSWAAITKQGVRDHREQGPAPPGGPAPHLTLIQPGQALAGLDPAFDDDENGSEGAITITSAGCEVVTQNLAEHLEVPPSMPDLKKLLDNELYDHAVREVGIAVEEELRLAVGNDDGFGQRLVREFVKHLDEELFAYNTILKIYRLRLRTFFAFTRNPHAHRTITLTRPQALALTAHALDLLGDTQRCSQGR